MALSGARPGRSSRRDLRAPRQGRLAADQDFAQYVVDRQGDVVKLFSSKVAPDDTELGETIAAALAK